MKFLQILVMKRGRKIITWAGNGKLLFEFQRPYQVQISTFSLGQFYQLTENFIQIDIVTIHFGSVELDHKDKGNPIPNS